MMKFINCFFILIISIFCSLHASAAIMQGGVSENSSVQQKYNRVIDKKTQIPVTGAKVRIPQIGQSSYTDNYGKFSVPSYTPQNSILSVQKQNYKPFSITINEKNIGKPLSIGIEKSNKFDIAEGISTLKVRADLIKNKYYLRLGVKDVNSTIMADALLGLPREISGKAMGLVEINSDASLKLNGDIKFNIQNGTIEKIGYVEYILKVAALFRNPLVMISPTTVGDLVNIPDGKFDVIKGELKLKDNVIERMMIKSSAKQLASFIVGRQDLNTNDATLRIYTKMSNKGEGFAGVLRNISLNSLANRISSSGRNESNYYASEIEQIPQLEVDEKDAQVFLTKVDGDVMNFNFLSSLKRIKQKVSFGLDTLFLLYKIFINVVKTTVPCFFYGV